MVSQKEDEGKLINKVQNVTRSKKGLDTLFLDFLAMRSLTAAVVVGCVLVMGCVSTVEGRKAMYGADDDDIVKCRTDVCSTPAASGEHVKYVNTLAPAYGAGNGDKGAKLRDPREASADFTNYNACQSGIDMRGRMRATRPFIQGATGRHAWWRVSLR